MRKLFLIGFCFIFSLIGCGKQKLQQQLAEFMRKEVAIPDGMRQMVEGRDTVVLNPVAGAARLVVWVDSIACSSCSLNQMFRYSEMIEYRNETGEEFVPLFLFSPPRAKIEEVILLLRYSQFDYPVFIDESNAFRRTNPHIPADSRFHTFLLDGNGKVLLIGDPVQNSELWKLYKTTVAGLINEDNPHAE
ncbi:MAG: hypothetical protein LBV38_05755 [Alistipes sp.]|jgi:hypothetical protein|nr:hypothetical protein [Alistipes sp.]